MEDIRAPDTKDLAEKDYINGMKYKDIAAKYDVSLNTVKSWKTRYKWSRNGVHTKEKVCTQKKNAKSKDKEPIAEEVKDVLENTDLTDKQRLFCIYYIRCFNATKAARKAGYQGEYLDRIGYQLLENTRVKEEIQRLKRNKLNRALLSEDDIFQKYMDIAFADITDFMLFGNEDITYMDDQDEEKTIKVSHANLKNDNEVDGTLISEVSKGKDGAKIKLNDRMKALEWLANHMDLATPEQRARINKLNAEADKLQPKEAAIGDRPFELPARLIAPPFAATVFDIEDKSHKEYVLYGGRGSTKSSFVGLEIINLIKKNPNMHALACRKIENTLRDSVYNQIKWAISALELEDEFNCKLSPLEIEYIPTGQRIYFRGCDDPTKIKSIKPPFGYIGILWFEELDQFAGPEQVRSIEQSAIRGGDDAYIFKTFNPPKTANNWANKYIKIPKENQYQLHSTYKDVPEKWLGKTFIEEAEHLKSVNPNAYEHEYLGVANGNGGNVFDNVEIRGITDEEINSFDRVYFGVDWGWYPDPWAFNKVYFNASQRILYIFDEARENKKSNKATYEILVNEHGIKPNDKIVCDSAENKSIGDYKSYGLFARGAIKGPGSVEYSMKWLQSLNKIIIDNSRCPHTATEFIDYEYERDKEGNVISGYPDINNHNIDAVRYATEEIWRRKGQ